MASNETIQLRTLDAGAADFDLQLTRLLAWDSVTNIQVAATVAEILQAVAEQGDEALLRYCRQLDGLSVAQAADLEISPQRLQQALLSLDKESRQALETAADRIRIYHEHQQQSSWQYREEEGTVLGQRVIPLDRVGVYVPGGKASYPSSVLMNVIPARVAGVREIIMVVPAPRGEINPLVLAAAAIAGVDRVFTIGGAQAIAALAFGTATIPKVDKIVGPGNIYVATAKQQVFGRVGLDMIAGPSEILIICDGATNPDWIAMDLFSQAEHDENAQAILVSPDADFLNAVQASMNRLLPTMERAAIIRQSLQSRGALIQVADLNQAIALANRIAPEHLELSIADPEAVLDKIRHAGAIFMGRHTAEALGDYCAGPSHVLPTSGTARFSSPLGVYDFQKRSSLIYCSRRSASALAKTAAILARGESLTAHARSAEYRLISSGESSDQE